MRAQAGISIILFMTDIIIQSTAGNSGKAALIPLCVLYLHAHVLLCVRVLPLYHSCRGERVCVPAGSDSQHTNLFNSLGAWVTDGGPLLLLAGPASKTSSRVAAAVRTQTKTPFTSSVQLFIFRGIRGNTRQGLSDPNSRTSLLFYTQASSQVSLIFSNCFLSCSVE